MATPNIDKLRLIVKTTDQGAGILRWDDVRWLAEHAPDLLREVEAIERLTLPIDHYERIAQTLFMQMDAMVAKAGPLIRDEIGKLRSRIYDLESELDAKKKAARLAPYDDGLVDGGVM